MLLCRSERSDSPRLSVRVSYGYHTVRLGCLLPLSCAAQIQPSDTAAFDGFDERKYAQWVARKKAMGEPVTELDPATYFDLQKSWCLIQKLDVPRTGRYVLIKLLRSRVPTADKIDVQVRMPQATPLTLRAVRWLQGIHRLSELLLRRALLTEIILCSRSLLLLSSLTLLVAVIVMGAFSLRAAAIQCTTTGAIQRGGVGNIRNVPRVPLAMPRPLAPEVSTCGATRYATS